MGILVSPHSLSRRSQLQSLLASSIDGILVVSGLVVTVATAGKVVFNWSGRSQQLPIVGPGMQGGSQCTHRFQQTTFFVRSGVLDGGDGAGKDIWILNLKHC